MALAWKGMGGYYTYMIWTDDEDMTEMPVPSTPPTIRYTNNESISLSEAGTEIGVVTRLGKKVFTVTWVLNSAWKEKIEQKCMKPTSTLDFGEYSAMTVRARITSCALARNSEYLDRTMGLWSISVTFTEV